MPSSLSAGRAVSNCRVICGVGVTKAAVGVEHLSSLKRTLIMESQRVQKKKMFT